MRTLQGMAVLLTLVLVLVALSTAVVQAQSVVINGTPLITSRAPVTIGGSMLLPMRDVFEALESEVKWFAAERKIMAVRGQTVIELWIGRPVATINGQSVNLPLAPMMLNGSTYVPLRFPAEAFGGTLTWQGATRTALIDIPPVVPYGTTTEVPPVTPPTPPVTPATPPVTPPVPTMIEGTVIQVVATPTGVLLQTADTGALVAVQTNAQTVITRGQSDAQALAAILTDARPGDLAQVILGADNAAARLSLTFGLATGKIVAIAGSTLVLEDGTAFRLSDQVRVFDAAGKALPLTGVAQNTPGQISFEPRSKQVWEIRLTAAPVVTPPTPQALPQIMTVGILNNTPYFKRGSVINLQMTGTPGGQATMTVGANGRLATDRPLAEVAPGKYQATLTVNEGGDLTSQHVTASLVVGGKKAQSVTSQTRLTIDNTPPVITNMLPAAGQSVTNAAPVIQMSFQPSTFAPLDTAATKLLLNHINVSNNAVVTAQGLTYQTQDLPNGPVTVEATVRDLAGNETQVNWVFTVATTNSNVVEAVWHDARAVLVAGNVLTINARIANPGGPATYSLGELVKNQPLTRLGDTKTYRGVYTVRPGDRLTDGILSVTYRDPQGRQGTMEATARISIDTGLPTALALTLPVDQSQVGDMIVAAGQAPPYSRVRVTIAYDTRIITQITGQLWQGTVVTDAKGVWRTAEISSSLGYLGRANNYTVLAELLDNAGKVVAQKQVKLHK